MDPKPADSPVRAIALGVSRPTIAGQLSGAYEIKQGELEQIAAVLGITPYNIIEQRGWGSDSTAQSRASQK